MALLPCQGLFFVGGWGLFDWGLGDVSGGFSISPKEENMRLGKNVVSFFLVSVGGFDEKLTSVLWHGIIRQNTVVRRVCFVENQVSFFHCRFAYACFLRVFRGCSRSVYAKHPGDRVFGCSGAFHGDVNSIHHHAPRAGAGFYP